MLRRLVIAVLAASGLAACTTMESFDVESFVRRLAPEGGEESQPPADPGWAETLHAEWYVPPQPPPVPRRKPDRTVAARPATPALREPDPELLLGLDFEATKALLGDPSLQLEHPPAKIWAYNGGICMFNVFFYPSMDDNVFRVLTYEVTDGEAKPKGEADAEEAPGPAKIRDRDSPILRRCFAEVLHSRDVPEAG